MQLFVETDHQGLEPINFGKGMSSFNPMNYVNVQLESSLLGEQVGYGDINGLMSLRQAICRYYKKSFDYDLFPERICITDGASGALNIAMAMLLKMGSEIILPESCYPAYAVLAKVFEAKCRLAPIRSDFCIDIEQLPNCISKRTQAILINSPSNPHGAFLQTSELSAIADLGVPIIFDEVYQSLPLVDEPIPSAIHFSDRHLIVSSLSKSLSIAGFRVGYLIVPEKYVQLMTNVKAVLNMCTSLPSQIIADNLLQYWDELLEQHKKLLRQNWLIFESTARNLGLKLRVQPKAGFFALVDVSHSGKDAMQLSLELARYCALSSIPGIDFQKKDHDFLRLNFACPSHQVKAGLVRLADYIASSTSFLK